MRNALRGLRATPGLAVFAILSLGLGIGANVAIFTLIDAVMLRPLSVPHPEELVKVTLGSPLAPNNRIWEQVRDRQDVFSGVFAYGRWAFNLTPGGEVRTVNGHFVSGQYFDTLGVRPVLGRTLTSADDKPGCTGAAVLRYGFWQAEYGGDANVIGKTISIDGHPIPVVGVAPPGFSGFEVGTTADIMVPVCAERVLHAGHSVLDIDRLPGFFQIVGRLKPGVTAAQGSARLKMLAPEIYKATLPRPGSMRAEDYGRYLAGTFEIEPAMNGLSYLRGQYRLALKVLMGMAGMVLLIACVNVASLLLSRCATRQREISIRMALGSGVARLFREQLAEGFLLSAFAVIVAVFLAEWGTRALTHYLGAFLDLVPDTRVLAFTSGIAILTALLCGIAPAYRATGVQPLTTLANARNALGGPRRAFGNILVIAQVAFSMLLVTGAGLMLATFRKLTFLDAGFERNGVLLASVNLPEGASPSLYPRILERLRGIPGVQSASFSNVTPVCHCAWTGRMVNSDGNSSNSLVYLNQVSDEYFATLGSAFLAGRDFDSRDTASAPRVAIVNRLLAQRYFGAENPLGRFIRISQADKIGEPLLIVGVVPDAKYEGLRDDFQPTVYTAWIQEEKPGPLTKFQLRAASAAPGGLIPGVKDAIGAIDPRVSIQLTTLANEIDDSTSRERLMAFLASLFGGLALLLAVIGIYSVTSYQVARRTNEIGIRMALGAAPSRVRGMVLTDVALTVGAGLLFGLAGALQATHLMESFLYGVQPNNPLTFFATAAVLSTVAILAGYLPARRPARMDPIAALRQE